MMMYMKCSKAFDTVPQDILRSQLSQYDPDEITIKWAHN